MESASAQSGSISISLSLAVGCNIFPTGDFHDSLSAIDLVGCFAMNREQDAAFQQSAFVSLGFILGNPHSDKSAGKPTQSAAHANPRKSRNQRPRCDDG